MSEREDVEFLAQVVHRGFLSRQEGRACFEALRAGEDLDSYAVASGLCPRSFWTWIRQTNAGREPILPRYDIFEQLGTGGTAEVFRAFGEREDREVALKILSMNQARDELARKRFLKECRLLIELDHPNIVKGYHLARFEQIYFLSMELVEGPTVLEILDSREVLDEDSALYIILQTARALEYMRSRGIVHRDIKPGNIMVGAQERVKLIDLGFATTGEELSRAGTTLGTAAYISPELARGSAGVDIRSDIYALGATLYQLVLGKLPFEGKTSEDVLRRHVMESLSAADLKGRRVSPHLHYFIEKMMAKERDLRYQKPAELIADIEAQIQGRRSLEYTREGDAAPERPRLLEEEGPNESRAVRRARLRSSRRYRGREH